MLEYCLQIQDARAHVFGVSLRIDAPQEKQRVSLPVWIPGSYLVREFAKHLSDLSASQKGQAVAVQQVDKCTWEVCCDPKAGPVDLGWQVYAFDNSVRMAFLDQCRGFANGTSVFLCVHGCEDEPAQLTVVAQDPLAYDWSLACALPVTKSKKGFFADRVSSEQRVLAVLKAGSYDELVDSPIEMGHFWQGSFKAAGVTHEFVVAGAPEGFDGRRLLADTKRICEAEIAFWHGSRGTPPFKRYVFMLNAVADGYGGLEHCASTALICKRADLPFNGDPVVVSQVRSGYQRLLGLISHEYFHAWSVKRMRPQELARYDYAQENYTELLWFFEGFTSYYDDRFLLRSGLVTPKQYLDWLCVNINSVEAMPGRFKQSVAQASFDAWVKYYRVDENTPNATVSYYTKGALVALCLDLTLRHESKGRTKTLDDVMRQLWKVSEGGPISAKDIEQALRFVGGRSYVRDLRAWVQGTQDLPVERLLQRVGVKLQRKEPTLVQQLGLMVVQTPAGVKVKNVLDGCAAQQAGISAGDELVGINGWRLQHMDDWKTYAAVTEGEQVDVLIARDGQLMNVVLTMQTAQGLAELVQPELRVQRKLKTALRTWF